MSAAEEWRSIPDVDSDYQASSLGRVRSKKSGAWRLMLGTLHADGYLRVCIARRPVRVHRLVAAAFFGSPPSDLVVRHLDGTKTNNEVSNLTYGTVSENERDKVRHGQHPNVVKQFCPAGHPYDELNTYRMPSAIEAGLSHRACRKCDALRARARRLAKRGVAA